MIIKSVTLICCLFLVGCATCEPKLVTKIERVVVKPPVELLNIPAYDMDIDVDSATQRTISEWILKSERRTQQLEDQLKALKTWYEETN
jgi:uncharacterized protein YcfL